MFCFLTTTQQDLIVSFTHYLTTLEPNLLWQDITQTFPYPDNDHCHCYADHVVKNAYTGSCKCLRGLQSGDNFRSSSSRSLRFGYLPRSCGDSPPPHQNKCPRWQRGSQRALNITTMLQPLSHPVFVFLLQQLPQSFPGAFLYAQCRMPQPFPYFVPMFSLGCGQCAHRYMKG